MTESLRLRGASTWQRRKAQFKKFFSNAFFDYRFFSHLLYFSGLVVEYVGYHYESKNPVRNGKERKYSENSICTIVLISSELSNILLNS